MPSPSKEDNVLKLILENSPFKEWHFEEMVRESGVTRAIANKWMKKYLKEGLLYRRKKKGKFPFFTVGENNNVYYSTKRLYALEQLHKCGLINELLSSPAKTIIIFGSMAKGDWHKDSDVDIFILGNVPDFDKKHYERTLNKNIELHIFDDLNEIRDIRTGLIQNVVNGYIVKGSVQDIARIS